MVQGGVGLEQSQAGTVTSAFQRSIARMLHQMRRLYWRIFRPVTLGVAAVLVDNQERVFLVKNSYRDGWHLPGGGVKRGETMMQAIQRELREEIGYRSTSEPREILGIYSNFTDRNFDHVVVFVIRNAEVDIPTSDNFEIEAARAFPLRELPADVGAGSSRRIREFLAGGPKEFVW